MAAHRGVLASETSGRRGIPGAALALAAAICIFRCGGDPSGPPAAPPSTYSADSLIVRAILDLNGLNLIRVDSVADSSAGRIVSLNLAYRGLRVLPDSLGRMDALTSLYLHGNRLSALPDSIVKLMRLATLTLGRNRLCSLPARIHAWADLYCSVAGWESTQDCDNYASDTAAVRAILDTNGLTTVRIADVTDSLDGRVTALRLTHLGLSVLPAAVGGLSRLADLDLHDNRLRALPDTVMGLDSLRSVSLDDNRLCTLSVALSAWADSLAPHWEQFQSCSTVVDPRPTDLFSASFGGASDTVQEAGTAWLVVQTGADSVVIDSILVSAVDTLLPPIQVSFAPVGVAAYYQGGDSVCGVNSVAADYGTASGSPAIVVRANSYVYFVGFSIDACLACSSLTSRLPGLRVGAALAARMRFVYRRVYPDTLMQGSTTLTVLGRVDGTTIGSQRWSSSGVVEFGDAVNPPESVDFSRLSDSCKGYLQLLRDTAPDFTFLGDSLGAPGGIKALGPACAASTFFDCQNLAAARAVLDTVACSTAQAGYRARAPFQPGYGYYMITREGDRVLLLNIAYYGGGVPRTWLLWAYYPH
jgi:hypothetical protein